MSGSGFGYLGALSGFLAVVFGALGAQGLREKLRPPQAQPPRLASR